MTKKIFAIAALAFLLVGCAAREEFQLPTDGPIPDTKNPEIMGEENPNSENIPNETNASAAEDVKVIGSCNSMETHSACIDYIGSVWTWQTIELSCNKDEGMVASREACPTGSVGGCRVGAGAATELITRFYNSGPEALEPESVQYAAAACSAALGSSWVSGN